MAARDSESARQARSAGPAADLALAKPPTQRFVRMAILGALLLLTLYTGLAVTRLLHGPLSPTEQLVSLVVPLVVAFSLGLLLLMESRRVERAHAAFSDSEQRFRLAVEAARCGIWEWDLAADRIFMSDVTAALFGWRGGVVDGQAVLDRVSEGHRGGLREALGAAAVSGGFAVSFRVPSQTGGRPVWIDARGQAFGKSPEGGYARIIGVALDVTEERLAQARAQAAETRLRDAIESVSEAFVLWDRQGRLLMCNRNYRSFFRLEPHVLKPGVARAELDAQAKLAIRQEFANQIGSASCRERV